MSDERPKGWLTRKTLQAADDANVVSMEPRDKHIPPRMWTSAYQEAAKQMDQIEKLEKDAKRIDGELSEARRKLREHQDAIVQMCGNVGLKIGE